jgi:hypothetical protein
MLGNVFSNQKQPCLNYVRTRNRENAIAITANSKNARISTSHFLQINFQLVDWFVLLATSVYFHAELTESEMDEDVLCFSFHVGWNNFSFKI